MTPILAWVIQGQSQRFARPLMNRDAPPGGKPGAFTSFPESLASS